MNTLKIAIQKSGRLHQDSLKILKDSGIIIENSQGQLKSKAINFPLEVLFLRNGDIPQYLNDGVVDIAILGSNVLIEKGKEISIVEKLGFSKCRLSVAVPKNTSYRSCKDLEGKRIATSYPNTVKDFLKNNNIQAALHTINGSVEIAPNIGLADAIVDIVSSGSTLFKNNLKETTVILESEAVLAASPIINAKKQLLLQKLVFRIRSVLQSKNTKYVLLNAPDNCLPQIINILPGMRSPTVVPLAEKGWNSLHSVISEEDFWEVIEELKAHGAEGILVCPIEKMIV